MLIEYLVYWLVFTVTISNNTIYLSPKIQQAEFITEEEALQFYDYRMNEAAFQFGFDANLSEAVWIDSVKTEIR